MKTFWRFRNEELDLRFYTMLLVGCWTMVVLLSLVWQLRQDSQNKLTLAREVARSHLEKDLILRDWNMQHGFVYAPVTSAHQPNPHLKMADREVVTPSGKTLTAINSSYMIRQIYELAQQKTSYQGHLTSLRTLRPENAPDPWERQALENLEKGAPEVSQVVDKNGQLYFRIIQPLKATEKCLACHDAKDYIPGQVAAGISASLPMTSVLGAWQNTRTTVLLGHGFLWLVGLTGLLGGAGQMEKKMQVKKEMEAALRQSESQFRLLVKTIPALVYRGYADGRVDFVDDKVEVVTGYSKEDFATGQMKWPNIILAEDLGGCKKIFLQALQRDGAYRREYRIRRKDNEIIWLEERSQIICDTAGKIDFVSGVVMDITLKKAMEDSLKESERFWKTLLEAVGVGLMVIDRVNGRITEVNPEAVAMLGCRRDQVIGQHREQFFECSTQGQPWQKKGGGKEHRSEGKLMRADGSSIPIWKTVAPLTIDEMQYLLVSFVDLTDQQQAEMALTQANQNLQTALAEIGQTNKEISLVGKMVELLQICHNPDEAYPIIGQYARELFPGLSGALYLLNASNNLLSAVSQWGESLSGDQFFSPPDCWALRQGRPYLCGTAAVESINPKCHHLGASAQGSHLCVPMTAQGETLGLLCVEKSLGAGEKEAWLSKAQQKLARTTAEHISLSLANLRLRETLRHQAIRDALTGLFNRRYLTETLDREIHRARRREVGLGVVMLDVDHFKLFNDTHGHEAGDRLLAVLGRYLKDAIRAEDIACRYGGEEFTLIMPEISPEALIQRSDTIRRGVKELEVLHKGKLLGPVTISLGLSCFPIHGTEGQTLLQAADGALYQAKKNGRDQVVLTGSLAPDKAVGDGMV